MTKPWTFSRGPVEANEADLFKAQAINEHLVRPISVLPERLGDPIKPFALGLWNEIRELMKPNISVTSLRRATGAYLHSKRYFFATAQPGSMRFDLNGAPTGPVSAADRLAAQERYQRLKRTDTEGKQDVASLAPALTKTERIRAALLSGR